MRKKLLTTLALLLMAVSGVWADDPDWLRYGDEWNEEVKMLTVKSDPDNHYSGNLEIVHLNIYCNDVTTIGDDAFSGCTNLEDVGIGDNVTTIGNTAFAGCTKLTSVVIPDGVTSIGEGAFEDCSDLASVTIGGGVETIGNTAFAGCTKLTSVVIPDGVMRIGGGAFTHTGLTSISINAATIGENAFDGCSDLTSVTIGNRVATIGSNVFDQCTKLATISVDEYNPKYDSRNGCNAIIETDPKTLIVGCNSTTIPNTVTSIGDRAFSYCTGLTSITIPASVTSIGNWAFSECTNLTTVTVYASTPPTLGYDAFNYCTSLANIYVFSDYMDTYKGAANWIAYKDIIKGFGYCGATGHETDVVWVLSGTSPNYTLTIMKVGETGAMADFGSYYNIPWESNSNNITSVIIEDGVTNIGGIAFKNQQNLTSITIANSVTTIGKYAFQKCFGLTEFTVPDGVTEIKEAAFDQCSNMETFNIGTGLATIDNNGIFWNCNNLATFTVAAGNTAFKTEDDVLLTYDGTELVAYPIAKTATSYTIPNGVITVRNKAFNQCTKLTEVTIPSSVTTIGSGAFSYCTSLATVTFEAGSQLATIGNSAFNYCPALEAITIPASVTTIGSGAFLDCAKLATATLLPATPPSMGQFAFKNIGSNASGKKFYFHGTAYGTNEYSDWNDMYNHTGYFSGYTSTVIYGATLSRGATTSPEAICSEGTTKYYTEGTSITLGHDNPPAGYEFGYTVRDESGDDITSSAISEDQGVYTLTMPAGDATVTAWKIISFEIDNITYEWTSETTVKVTGCNNSPSSLIIPGIVVHNDVSYYVTEIGEEAFMDNTSLLSIDISHDTCPIEIIRARAFKNCTNLPEIRLPASLTRIEAETFSGCTNLTSVTIPFSVTYVSGNAFSYCNENLIIYVPEDLVDDYRSRLPDANILAVSTNPIPYIAADGTEAYCDEYIVLNGNNDYTKINRPGWYVVKNSNTDPEGNDGVDISFPQGLTINGGEGDVNLILLDGAEMSIENENENFALQVNGNSFNIYGQSGGTGKLTTSTDNDHGIYAVSCDMTINGGTISASGVYYGINADGGAITINNGTVNATSSNFDYGSGISASQSITISGGTVEAHSKCYGISSYTGDIIISGGNVTVECTDYYSGIGIFCYEGNITISGGTVEATSEYLGICTDSGGITISGGSVTATGKGEGSGIDSYKHITISNGSVTATGGEKGIFSSYGITINGGSVTATGDDYGLYSVNDNIEINGGVVEANGNQEGILAQDGYFFLNWTSANDRIKASSYKGNADEGTRIVNGKAFTDGEGNIYRGTLTQEERDYIAGKTLVPSVITLAAKQVTVDGRTDYWTTFYSGDAGYGIDAEENACAYTATYEVVNEVGTITLHKLGKVIPKGTAVIIVGADASISMTTSTAAAENTVSNHLHGVDVVTPLSTVKSTYSANTILVLSNKNNHFGFHDLATTNVPARKAFLALSGETAKAREFMMVFDDATGIHSIDNGQLIMDNEAGAWYSLDGRRLSGKPTQKGLYIHNGTKVLIK